MDLVTVCASVKVLSLVEEALAEGWGGGGSGGRR